MFSYNTKASSFIWKFASLQYWSTFFIPYGLFLCCMDSRRTPSPWYRIISDVILNPFNTEDLFCLSCFSAAKTPSVSRDLGLIVCPQRPGGAQLAARHNGVSASFVIRMELAGLHRISHELQHVADAGHWSVVFPEVIWHATAVVLQVTCEPEGLLASSLSSFSTAWLASRTYPYADKPTSL